MSSLFESFEDSVPQHESTNVDDDDGSVGYNSTQLNSFSGVDDVFKSDPPVYVADREVAPEENEREFDGEFGGLDGPILPPPTEMDTEEGFALREWRRENAIRLEEKEKREKEALNQILLEAEDFKVKFYKMREITCEENKVTCREKEKVFVANQETFYAEVDKNYWKAIAELIPNEVPAIEKKRGKKDQEKKPVVVVIHGPKPGKPTDLSRMRQILIKLKHNTPPHLKPSPPPAAAPKDVKADDDASATVPNKAATLVTTPEAVAVA